MPHYVGMVSLVGEQPIANLVPILYFKPQYVDFICTDRTRKIAEHSGSVLKETVGKAHFPIESEIWEVDPYDMLTIETELNKLSSQRNWDPEEVIFNLTGGTKTMAISTYRIAESLGAPFCYLISEDRQNMIHTYRSSPTRDLQFLGQTKASDVIDIDLYLRAHLGEYDEGSPRHPFERLVYEVLKSECDEVKTSVRPRSHGNIEIDFVVRKDSTVGIVEVKGGQQATKKRALEQIITAAEAPFLGTYTKRFLVLDRKYTPDNLELAKSRRIVVIETPSAQEGKFSDEDELKLRTAIREELGI